MRKGYKDLLKYTSEEYGVPESFFEVKGHASDTCVILVSCLDNDERILYLQDSFEVITGYPQENFIQKGMDFWFPLIHPEDLPAVMEKIIQNHQQLFKPGFTKEQHGPLVLEYRFKRPDGEWWQIRDTKYLLFPGNEVCVDEILCKFELVTPPIVSEMDAEEILRKEKSCTRILEYAVVHNNGQSKQNLKDGSETFNLEIQSLPSQLTKREKEILHLIGEGLSTKMIAEKCHISINTVETHRRHLLEKLNVKNSSELIKEASKVYWL